VTQYVVASKNEDGVRVFGVYRNRAAAEALVQKVNAEIERREDAEFAEWQTTEPGSDNMVPDGYGRCGVLIIHPKSYKRALRFALGELDS
jgi:hypothetical protein